MYKPSLPSKCADFRSRVFRSIFVNLPQSACCTILNVDCSLIELDVSQLHFRRKIARVRSDIINQIWTAFEYYCF